MKTILKIMVAAGLASALTAQNQDVLNMQRELERVANKVNAATTVFNWQTADFVSGQLISGPPVKGAPYSADAVSETIQTLTDGNRIVQRTTAMQYRDSEGRERREETAAMGAIFITDPVAGARYTLHPDSRTAEKGPMAGFSNTTSGGPNVFYYSSTDPAGGPAGGRGAVTVAVAGRVATGGRGAASPVGEIRLNAQPLTLVTGGRTAIGTANAKTEKLAKMYIEGVEAEGTRTTTTIPAGEIGNDRPINIVDERWYSPDLQMTIMTKHSDPRSGETNFALKNINRSIPPPYLFEVPSDYTVSAGGGRGGRVAVHETRE